MLSPIVKALPNKAEKFDSKSLLLPPIRSEPKCHESDGLLYIDCTLVIAFSIQNAVMRRLHDACPV